MVGRCVGPKYSPLCDVAHRFAPRRDLRTLDRLAVSPSPMKPRPGSCPGRRSQMSPGYARVEMNYFAGADGMWPEKVSTAHRTSASSLEPTRTRRSTNPFRCSASGSTMSKAFPSDDQGRMQPDQMPKLDEAALVIAQAGNVNRARSIRSELSASARTPPGPGCMLMAPSDLGARGSIHARNL